MVSESHSIDSTSLINEIRSRGGKPTNSYVVYKSRIKTIKQIIILLAFLLLIVAIFSPWLISRGRLFISLRFLLNQYISSYAALISSKCKQHFMAFETASDFMSHSSSDIGEITCTTEGVNELIKFWTTAHRYMVIKPMSVLLSEQTSFCEMRFNNTAKDKFTFAFYNESEDKFMHGKIFYETTNFSDPNWVEQGEPLSTVLPNNISEILAENKNYTFWSNKVSPYSLIDAHQMTAITPIYEQNGSLNLVGGYSLSTLKIAEILQSLQSPIKSNFAFMTMNDGVIFDSLCKSHEPQSFKNHSVPIYPRLNELNNSFWDGIFEIFNKNNFTDYMDTIDYWYEDEEYLVWLEPIQSKIQQTHKILFTFRTDDFLSDTLIPADIILVLCVLILCILLLIFIKIKRRNDAKTEKKVNKHIPTIQNEDSLVGCGAIGQAYTKARHLQLMFPDDLILNKIIDNAVLSMTEPNSRYFSVYSSCECEYCKNLPKRVAEFYPNIPENVYTSWKKRHKVDYKHNRHFNCTPWSSFVRNPSKELVKLMIYIIQSDDLLFPEFDPDAMTFILKNIAMHCIQYPLQTVLNLFWMRKMIHGPFKHWISNKFDLFMLYFCVFVKDIQAMDALNIFDDGSHNDEEEMEYVQNCLLIFSDEYSKTEHNIGLICHLLKEFIPESPAGERVTSHFQRMLFDTLFSIEDERMFHVFGQFHIRVESPDFSVANDEADRHLFMKALLKFVSFCPYYEKTEIMEDILQHQNQSIFSPDELGDVTFVASYHVEYMRAVVSRVINLFAMFSPMNDVQSQFNVNMDYWKSKT